MAGAWEKRVARRQDRRSSTQIANPHWGFDLLQDDEYQMLWLDAALQPEGRRVPEPEYDEKGNYKPSKYVKELLQSFDPNEKYGTQGGGDDARRALGPPARLHRRLPEPADARAPRRRP